jgi:hypothetical protein
VLAPPASASQGYAWGNFAAAETLPCDEVLGLYNMYHTLITLYRENCPSRSHASQAIQCEDYFMHSYKGTVLIMSRH